MTTYVPPKKNTAFVFYISLVSQASSPDFQANPTLAAGDAKVAIDDGAPANLATLPAVDADFTKRVKVSLSASEMNGDNISIIFSDAAGAEWHDLSVLLQTATQQVDDLASQASVNTIDDFLDTEIATLLTSTGTTIPGLIAALNNLSAAQVNAELLDVLTTDTFSQPGQENPAATTTLALMIRYLYKAWRNKKNETSTEQKLFADDASTVDQKRTISSDGTTLTVGEMATGA